MEKKKAISQYRERLDKTLSSAELTDSETLKILVKNQILRYAQDEKEEFSEDLLDKRAQEVSNFLDMLRSTSIDDRQVSKSSETSHGEWKLKQDNEEFRVMYREGPHGTPIHTLLVEGYVDGPLDVCLCISWESALYRKWWPQSSFPSFKVTSSTCLQKVRIGEQISLVRVKVAWPLSAREALVHYFFFEYFQDDLIVILVNTISDVSSIGKDTHGYANDGIPEAKDVVRIDLVGGFALQKVNNERSYFRTIVSMDMKLDFVPPSLINFISRQLIGSETLSKGSIAEFFMTVASVSNFDEDYSEALGDPLFALIREVLYSSKKSGEVFEAQEHKREAHLLPNETLIEGIQKDMHDIEQKVYANDHAAESPVEKAQDTKRKAFGEIEEEESEDSTYLEEGITTTNQPSANKFTDTNGANDKKRISIRPEVEEALGTLEKAISIIRQYGFNAQSRSSSFSGEETANLEEGAVKDLAYAADEDVSLKVDVPVEATSKKFEENLEMTSDESKNSNDINNTRSAGSNSFSREVNHNKVVPASPQQNVSIPVETNQVALNSYRNGFHENGLNEAKKLKAEKMYNRKKLWIPLSSVVGRALPKTRGFTPYFSNSPVRSLSSNLEPPSRVPPYYARDILPNLKFFAKSFCSESAIKVETTIKRCWNCEAVSAGLTPFLYCDSCRSIQPVDLSIDYFQIFGLEKKYDIEVDGLEGKYKDWQKKLHPDLVHSKSEKEREYAAEQSARVIDAYRALSKPLSRAIYILRLEGVDVDEEQTVSDPELLTEILEIREAVEEAPDSQALNQIQSQMKEKLEESGNSFANAYQRRNFDEAVACIQRMTYYQRASEEILKKL
ncbi:hypothetical protein DITRI_Ditri12bG0123900 [Diplodiscus trichospermus]